MLKGNSLFANTHPLIIMLGKSKYPDSVRIFKNPVLEYFSHIHPATPLVCYIPVVVYFFYQSLQMTSLLTTFSFFMAGLLVWTFVEYTLHRFFFHFEFQGKVGNRIHFLIHGVHHDYPKDATRLVMPLLVSVPLAFLFYFIFKLVFSPYHESIFSGMVLGYIFYDTLHYAFHHFAMKGKIFSFLKKYHLVHHYLNPDSGFGVSTPLWDFVFRTVEKPTDQVLELEGISCGQGGN